MKSSSMPGSYQSAPEEDTPGQKTPPVVPSIVDLPRYQDPRADALDDLDPARGIILMAILVSFIWSLIALLFWL